MKLADIGTALANPGRLVGLHFFNPVPQMQLVEIVAGEATDPEWAKKGAAFARQIDKLPLPVKDSPGFLVNRVLGPYLLKAFALVDEGTCSACGLALPGSEQQKVRSGDELVLCRQCGRILYAG